MASFFGGAVNLVRVITDHKNQFQLESANRLASRQKRPGDKNIKAYALSRCFPSGGSNCEPVPILKKGVVIATISSDLEKEVVEASRDVPAAFPSGFQIGQGLRIFFFCVFFGIYCGTICGNLLIITLVFTCRNLHTPMYFFISQLSISDILVITDIVPNLLNLLLYNGGNITVFDCITQFYFLCASEAFECFLLTVMAYDRYVAICNPLRYSTIMTSGYCVILSMACWVFGFSAILTYIIKMGKLIFCGSNTIDHLFCDILPLLELSCSDTFIIQLEIYVMAIPTVMIPISVIVISYTYIVLAILRIRSSSGRYKAFSTCSSHLIVVSIFYWTMFSVYVVPTKGQTSTMSKILSLLYTVFTPFINPIIYSLRNKDIRKAIMLYISKFLFRQ
ncbi:olfactory receptor 5P56-like [Phyllobates terribilis]|uniref:olfactory receptor 5P56-like n=1 Tax=Phyllobates terribilis TaxID=111132 RepID=UPI003CCA9F57